MDFSLIIHKIKKGNLKISMFPKISPNLLSSKILKQFNQIFEKKKKKEIFNKKTLKILKENLKKN